jgi:hypothetical protein
MRRYELLAWPESNLGNNLLKMFSFVKLGLLKYPQKYPQ